MTIIVVVYTSNIVSCSLLQIHLCIFMQDLQTSACCTCLLLGRLTPQHLGKPGQEMTSNMWTSSNPLSKEGSSKKNELKGIRH